MASYVVPTPRAVLLCAGVVEAGSGTVHIAHAFDTIRPTSYPHEQSPLCVAVHLVGGLGDVPLSVQVVPVAAGPDDEVRALFSAEPVEFHFPDRLTLVRAVLRFRSVPFREPGRYLVEIHCGNEFIGDAPLRLLPAAGRNHENA